MKLRILCNMYVCICVCLCVSVCVSVCVCVCVVGDAVNCWLRYTCCAKPPNVQRYNPNH